MQILDMFNFQTINFIKFSCLAQMIEVSIMGFADQEQETTWGCGTIAFSFEFVDRELCFRFGVNNVGTQPDLCHLLS